ncbi:hypothetical protein RSAG8_07370, partial [Rhizoctonia solani AG-8 WAC10335]
MYNANPKLIDRELGNGGSFSPAATAGSAVWIVDGIQLEGQQYVFCSFSPAATAGSAVWIVDGIQLEGQQSRLIRDLKQLGTHHTPRQILSIAARRKELQARIEHHNNDGTKWLLAVAITQTSTTTISKRPEHHTVLLASTVPAGVLTTNGNLAIMETERELRRVQCLRALQILRALST